MSVKILERSRLGNVARHIQGISSGPDEVKLRGESFKGRVTDAVVGEGIAINRTIEGASTLSIPILDKDRRLRRSELLTTRFGLTLDGLGFIYVGASKTDDTLTLTAESKEVWALRQLHGPKKAVRGDGKLFTRAEFVASLVKEARPKITFYSPDRHVTQPIRDTKEAVEALVDRDVKRGKGIDEGAGEGLDKATRLTVKGEAANPEQLRNGDTVLRVGASLDAPRAAMVSVIVTGIAENTMLNVGEGYFQITDGTASGLSFDRLDLAAAAHHYFTKGYYSFGGAIEIANGGETNPAVISSQVEGNAAGASDRTAYIDEAAKWVDAFDGGGVSSSGSSISVTKEDPYAFEVEPNETYWDAMQRLAQEVNYRCFESAGIVYFIDEFTLLDSRIRLRIHEGAEGLTSKIDWDADTGKRNSGVSFTAFARSWAAPPGTVILTEGEGIANGRYIVSTIDSKLSSPDVTITAKRPTKPLPEPAPTTSTKTISFGGGGSSSNGSGGGSLDTLRIDTSPGAPHWGGSADIVHAIADPIFEAAGISPGGTKESGHTAGGDHDPAEVLAFATDYSTSDGEQLARAVARAFGDESVVHTYNSIPFSVDGHDFEAQVLWDLTNPSPGPGDYAHRGHVHVGCHRLGS